MDLTPFRQEQTNLMPFNIRMGARLSTLSKKDASRADPEDPTDNSQTGRHLASAVASPRTLSRITDLES